MIRTNIHLISFIKKKCVLHSRKNRNIEPERALKFLKMGLKREIRTFWSVFFIFRPACVIFIKR